MAEINAEHSLVGIHQSERIELKPGHTRDSRQHRDDTPALSGRRGGQSKHAEPAGRGQKPITLLPGFAADWIEDQLDPAAACDLARARFKILGAVIDEMIDTER